MNAAQPYDILATGAVSLRWIAGTLPVTPEQEEEVDYIWERAVDASGGHLFNGAFLHMLSSRKTARGFTAKCLYAEYKYFYVHRLRPDLGLNVRAIGVSGLTRIGRPGAAHFLAAVRGPKMTQYPGDLEFVPSGTIDRGCAEENGVVRYEAKILEELREETALPFRAIANVQGFAFTYDRADDTYDVCCLIDVDGDPEAIRAALVHTDEYTDPVLVAESDLAPWVAAQGDRLMPVSQGIAAAYGAWR